MGGSEDTGPGHQAGAEATPTPNTSSKSNERGIQKTGELMLVFALLIVLALCVSICIHLVLRQRRRIPHRQARKAEKKRREKDMKATKGQATTELDSASKKIFEAAGTQVVLAELAEAPPLHELEAVVLSTPSDRAVTITTAPDVELNSEVNVTDPWPRGRDLATYWAMR